MVDFNKLLNEKRKGKQLFTDISICCETLGLRPDAAIISIGATALNRYTGYVCEFGKSGQELLFYKHIEIDSAVKSGSVDGSTIAWWMGQPNAADTARSVKSAGTSPLSIVLYDLAEWVKKIPMDDRVNNLGIWTNGPAQDIVWLESAYRNGAVGQQPPWRYSQARDLRTLIDTAEMAIQHSVWLPRDSQQHDALADAIYQARMVCECTAILCPGLVTMGATAKIVDEKRESPIAKTDDSNDW